MTLDDFTSLSDDDLRAEFRAYSRDQLNETFQYLGGQRSVIAQKLEAIFGPEREAVFASIRPGGLAEIDVAIAQAKTEALKERTLLAQYRDLNRILLHFMDVYEENVFKDLDHMSKDELNMLYKNAEDEKKRAEGMLTDPNNYRKAQDAAGILRLAGLFKEEIAKQLKNRFGTDPTAL